MPRGVSYLPFAHGCRAGAATYEVLDPAAARAVNPALRGEFAGGLLCRADAAVEPRLVPAALRAAMFHLAVITP